MIEIRLDLEERRYVDKCLYKYKTWERLRKTCMEEAEWIDARYGARSSSDFSALAELGTRIDTSELPSSPQERTYAHKARIMRDQQDYADILRMRIRRVERAMEEMTQIQRRVLEERYFNRKSMEECIGSVDGLTEKGYANAVTAIRDIVAPYVLGVFMEANRK